MDPVDGLGQHRGHRQHVQLRVIRRHRRGVGAHNLGHVTGGQLVQRAVGEQAVRAGHRDRTHVLLSQQGQPASARQGELMRGRPGNCPAGRSGLLAVACKTTITRFAPITSQDLLAWSRRRRRSRCAAAEGYAHRTAPSAVPAPCRSLCPDLAAHAKGAGPGPHRAAILCLWTRLSDGAWRRPGWSRAQRRGPGRPPSVWFPRWM